MSGHLPNKMDISSSNVINAEPLKTSSNSNLMLSFKNKKLK
ncbi:hypothetical protein J520_3063 [Acinetobacter sp. 869535]|nr:hypothetical protein J520_3063 [Acinetobacter sp. 869535]